MKKATLLAAAMLFAVPALADDTWRRDITDSGPTCPTTIGPKDVCYHAGTGAQFVDSKPVRLTSQFGSTICFDPDTTTDGSATATISVRRRIWGSSVADPDSWAVIQGGGVSVWTGATGANCMFSVAPGMYYIEVIASPGVSETAVVSVEGN